MIEYIDLYEKHPGTHVPSHKRKTVSTALVVDTTGPAPRISKSSLADPEYVLPSSSRSVDSYPYYVDGLKYYIGRRGKQGFDLYSKHVRSYRRLLWPVWSHPKVSTWIEVLDTRWAEISRLFKGTTHSEAVLPIIDGEPLAQPAKGEAPTPLQAKLQAHFQRVDAEEKKSFDGAARQCIICKERKMPGRLASAVAGGVKWTTHNQDYTKIETQSSGKHYPLEVCAQCAAQVSAGYAIATGATAVSGQSDLWFTRKFGRDEPLWLMVFNGTDEKEQLTWITEHINRPRELLKAVRRAARGHESALPTSPLRVKLYGKQETQMLVHIDELVAPETLFSNVERFGRLVREGTSLSQMADAFYRVKKENEKLKATARADLLQSMLLGYSIPERWIEMWHVHRVRRSARGTSPDYWAGTRPRVSELSLCALITNTPAHQPMDTPAFKLGEFLAAADLAYYKATDKSFYASTRHWREMVESPEDGIANLGEKLVRQGAGGALEVLADVTEIPDTLTPREQAEMTLGFAHRRQLIFDESARRKGEKNSDPTGSDD